MNTHSVDAAASVDSSSSEPAPNAQAQRERLDNNMDRLHQPAFTLKVYEGGQHLFSSAGRGTVILGSEVGRVTQGGLAPADKRVLVDAPKSGQTQYIEWTDTQGCRHVLLPGYTTTVHIFEETAAVPAGPGPVSGTGKVALVPDPDQSGFRPDDDRILVAGSAHGHRRVRDA